MATAATFSALAPAQPLCSPRAHGRCRIAIPTGARRRQAAVVAAEGSVAATTATASSDGTRFDMADWDGFLRGYKSQHVERSFSIDDSMVDGAIPTELEGTLLRNGPGLFEVGGKQIPQPFDGDGMVAMFAFKGGKAYFANRYIRTKGFVAEQQAQRLLFRGAFSVGNPAADGRFSFYNPFDLSVKGVANTGVVHWGGKLLALYERDLPYELSTPELRTRGQTVAVPTEAPYFGAHYRITQGQDGGRRLVAFNAAERGQDNRVNVFEYDEKLQLLHRVEFDVANGAFGFFHDFAVTEQYYVFLENPMSLDLWKIATKYMLGKACIAECIMWDGANKKTRVHLVPRPGSAAARGSADPASLRRVFDTAPFFSFHHANAYEAGGRLVIDTVANHDGVDFSANFESGPTYYDDDMGRGTLTRLVLDLQTGAATHHRLMDRACEFPCVAPAATGKPHSHVYVAASRFGGADTWGAPQVVCKVSLPPAAGVTEPCGRGAVQQDIYYPGRHMFAQEPIFVPRPGGQNEDDGWVLALVFDSAQERTKLVILDARQLSAGPVATITLPHMLPLGLHGSWTGSYLGPQPGQARSPTEYDIRNGVSLEHGG